MSSISYKLKVQPVQAVHYQKQLFIELPQWTKEFEIQHGADTARLHIEPFTRKVWVPMLRGHILAAIGDWLVFDGKIIAVIKDDDFQRLYERIETIDVPPPE